MSLYVLALTIMPPSQILEKNGKKIRYEHMISCHVAVQEGKAEEDRKQEHT
jgi:hypothetical protein